LIRNFSRIDYKQTKKTSILKYSKKQAIEELIGSKKIEEKIQQIEQYVKGLRND